MLTFCLPAAHIHCALPAPHCRGSRSCRPEAALLPWRCEGCCIARQLAEADWGVAYCILNGVLSCVLPLQARQLALASLLAPTACPAHLDLLCAAQRRVFLSYCKL